MTKAGLDESKLDQIAIGVAGLPGSGKSVVARLLAEQLGAEILVMGDVVRDEAKKRGVSVSPAAIRKLMVNLRKEQGVDVIAQKCLQKIADLASAPTTAVIIDGLRSLAELAAFRKGLHSFYLVFIHASPQVRFHRLSKRDRSDDPTAWATFEARDSLEAQIGVSTLLDQADYSITNEQDLEMLERQVRELAKWMEQKEVSGPS